ncbi:MAG: CmpA/NrtA family ABC transporter substrate-binding protein [Planctomycetota bacterium]
MNALAAPATPKTKLEKRDLTLGLVPLNDCAPIAVGVEKGFFADQGLNVTTTREGSWAGIRDQVAFGLLDGAQMLATMPICTTLGLGGFQCDMTYGVTLGLNGNAITLASWLCDEIDATARPLQPHGKNTADGLADVIRRRASRGEAPLRLGAVFPMSTHELELRYWLAAAGIDPARDVEIVVVPPPRMVEALRAGELAGFCVGEPWNSLAVAEGLGRVAITKHALWTNGPEKVLGVTAAWADQHPGTHVALIAALIEAGRWLDQPGNRAEACEILSLPQYVGVEPSLIRSAMTGSFRTAADADPVVTPDFHVFHRHDANVPWRSQALWWLTQMHRWGQVEMPYEAQLALSRIVRDDLFAQAADRLGLPTPDAPDKLEDTEAFFDGRRFDPAVIDLNDLPNPNPQALTRH